MVCLSHPYCLMVDTSTGLLRDESATQQAGVPSSSSTSDLVTGVVMIAIRMIWITSMGK